MNDEDRMTGAVTSSDLLLLSRAREYGDRIAIEDSGGAHTYAELLAASERVAGTLLAGRQDLDEARVAFLTPPDFSYTAVQWGVWRAGGIAVPLATSHPPPEWEYVLRDAGAELAVVESEF
jgi:malonyl-CoA/methylmalonyl-CoA synthetase